MGAYADTESCGYRGKPNRDDRGRSAAELAQRRFAGDDAGVTMPPPAAAIPAVRLDTIAKRFGDVVAIEGATFEAGPGEIHALLGENGAGKTSLMNVLAGVYRPDGGTIRLDGRPVTIPSPEAAKRLGIGMVHQEQRLVSRFTAPENVALGHAHPRWHLPLGAFRALATGLSARFGMPIDAQVPVSQLGSSGRSGRQKWVSRELCVKGWLRLRSSPFWNSSIGKVWPCRCAHTGSTASRRP